MTSQTTSLLAVLLLPAMVSAQDAASSGPRIEWTAAPALHTARDHHATFLAHVKSGDFLYVAGGTNYQELYDSIERARIRADGSLDAWQSAGRYPQPLAGSSVAVTGDYAVLTGGQIAAGGGVKGLRRVANSYVARINDDGSIGSWQPAAPLPAPRFHHPSLFHNGWVYVVGGQGEAVAETGVFAARLSADGKLGEWQQLRPLPRPRSHHAVFIEAGNMYVVGGLDGSAYGQQAHFTDVIRAPIAEDGSIGEWQLVSRTPHAYSTHSAFAHDGYIWVLGGVEDGNRFVDTIWRAELRADGRVGAWEQVTPGLPVARGHVHNTPVFNGHVYSIGGRGLPASPDASPVHAEAHVGRFVR